ASQDLHSVPTRRSSDLPIGLWRLDAEAEEGERRQEQHGKDEAKAKLGHQRRKRIGQDLAKDDPAPAFAPKAGGLDEIHHIDIDRSEEHTSELQSRFELV